MTRVVVGSTSGNQEGLSEEVTLAEISGTRRSRYRIVSGKNIPFRETTEQSSWRKAGRSLQLAFSD